MGRIAHVLPTRRRTCSHRFDRPTLSRLNRRRLSKNLFAEYVVGYGNQDAIFFHVVGWPDGVRRHGQVVDAELACAEQRLLIDAGRLAARIADVRGRPNGGYARALRINELDDHTEETL